jgi:hypothetical protein
MLWATSLENVKPSSNFKIFMGFPVQIYFKRKTGYPHIENWK